MRKIDGMEERFNASISTYNFTDDLPKEYLFIKLDDNISPSRRAFITNGIRSYFRDELTVLLDRRDIHESLVNNLNLFQIFVGIVGFIALTLSFFLLLISTTANIKENLWEFGVLRAIGLNQEQSKRVYMYEAFAVIFGSLSLGILVGLTIAITLTAQFYLFIELPFKLSVRSQIIFNIIYSSLLLYSLQ